MMIVDASKYVSGWSPASWITSGNERHDDAVQPGGARSDGDERVHVRGPVTGGAPRRPVEPAARAQNWTSVAGTRASQLMVSIGMRVWGTNITTMIPTATAIDSDGLAEQRRVPRARDAHRPASLPRRATSRQRPAPSTSLRGSTSRTS